MTGAAAPQLEVADLLRIDVGAELATLSEAQLQGPWQVPSELVRLAVQCNATMVSVRTQRGGFEVRMSGGAIEPVHLRRLSRALDDRQPPEARHRAIVKLEAAGMQPLLWATGIADARVHIESVAVAEEERWVLQHRPSQQPQLRHERTTSRTQEPRATIQVVVAGFEGRRAVSWLNRSCRFVPVPVKINHEPAPRGFPSGLYRMRLRRPLPMVLAVALKGDVPRLWLLRHGVLVTRATVPGYPAFEVAVEMASLVPPAGVSAAALREAVSPYLTGIIDRAVGMLVRLSPKLPSMTEPSRRRICCLLLRAAAMGLRRSEIGEALLIRVLGGEDEGERWVGINQLPRLGRGEPPLVDAVEPEGGPVRSNLPPRPTAVVSTEERGLLQELLPIRFQVVARRRRGPLRARVRRLLADIPWLVSRLFEALRGGTGRVVALEELSDQERTLLAELKHHCVEAREGRLVFRFCDGSGAIRRAKHAVTRILLPRRGVETARLMAALEARDQWLYPALLVALGDAGTVTPELRSRWVRAMLRGAVNEG